MMDDDKTDGDLAAIDTAFSTVLLRLRTWHCKGPNHSPTYIFEALQIAADKVKAFIDANER